MKVEVKEQDKPKPFVPISINILLESEDELLTFWALVNASEESILSNACNYPVVVEKIKRYKKSQAFIHTVPYSLFDKVDEVVKNLGLKNIVRS